MTDAQFTLRCAVQALIIKNNKLLMFRRANTGWEDGKYGVPGGHLEQDETILEAVIREIKEESGLKVLEKDIDFIHISQRKSNYDYIDLFFIVKKWKGTPRITEEDKSDDMIWADLNKLPTNILEHLKSAIDKNNNKIIYSQFEL